MYKGQQNSQQTSFELNSQQLQQAVQGSRWYFPAGFLSESGVVTGLSTDSRAIPQGSLFVALRGERFDAHDFLPQIASSGAAAVVAQQIPEHYPLPALLVPDTQLALSQIATFWRQQFSLPVIAVTGSNGKTTLKEMIASILRQHAGVAHSLATSGNLNNEIGVPLTVLRLRSDHQCAVFELGMNHPGEIAQLAAVACPTVALVNNAQREHQEFMQTVSAVAQENGSVFQSLPEQGCAVFPHADAYSDVWHQLAQARGKRKTLTFGWSENADVFATYSERGDAEGTDTDNPANWGSQIQIHLGNENFKVHLATAGEHNVLNALAAAACCHAIGVTNASIAAGLEAFTPVQGRLQYKRANNAAVIIDDTYNANPDSVRAAIDVLAQQSPDGILVLGDMGEVGSEGVAFHAEVGAYAQQKGIAQLFCLGQLAQHAALAFGSQARHFSDLAELLAALDGGLTAHSIVLVKGSRFMKMERVVQHLT